MVAYYWEDTETESIPLSSEWAEYRVNDAADEIIIHWDDGIKQTEKFRIKNRGRILIIGEAEFKLSDREIFLN